MEKRKLTSKSSATKTTRFIMQSGKKKLTGSKETPVRNSYTFSIFTQN